MKQTKYTQLDRTTLREGIRDSLTARAQYIVKNLDPVVAHTMSESYTEQPYKLNPAVQYFTQDDVKMMLGTWETPNADDYSGSYADNIENDVHKVDDLVDDQQTASTEKDTSIESDYDRTIRLMKAMYQLEESEAKIIEVDPDNGDDSDESEFKAALVTASKDDTEVAVELEDGSEVVLDSATIKSILDSDELFHKLTKNLDSIDSFTKTLGVGLSEEEDESLEESEEIVLPESLLEMYDYLDSIQADALYDFHENLFLESAISLDKLAAKLQQSGTGNNRNRMERGKIALVNRVRGGKLQMRKAVSNKKGYKIKDGQAVRMKPAEIKKRKLSARIASKKRRNQMSQINRKRGISLNIRDRRLG